MRPLIDAEVLCNTEQNAATLVNRINTAIANLTVPNVTVSPTIIAWHNNQWLVNVSVACLTETDADTLHAMLVDAWTTGSLASRLLSGSRVKRTNNFDDEGAGRPDDVLYITVKA